MLKDLYYALVSLMEALLHSSAVYVGDWFPTHRDSRLHDHQIVWQSTWVPTGT